MNFLKNIFALLLTSLIATGCLSTKNGEQKDDPLSGTQQKMMLARARPPQQFGFSIYPSRGGVAYSGAGRLHPNHFISADFIEGQIPAIKMRGRSKRNSMVVLVDSSSPVSWIEFSTSQDFGVHFLGINNAHFPYRGTYNTGGVNAYAGVITQVRIEHLFIENIPFYVRMSRGSLGPLARGIHKPKIDAVMGYDNLAVFEYVQFNLKKETVSFSASQVYTPNADRLVDIAKIVDAPGHGLAIEGQIDGKSTPIILDFAGHFSLARGDIKVATTRAVHMGHILLHDVPTLVLPAHTAPPRVGRKLLSPYLITICNREGVVYFER